MPEKSYTLEELRKLKSLTDQERLDRMTEEEIDRNAREDPDSVVLDDEQLERLRKVEKHDAEKK
ncbi:MAG TPA: hypothetical protein VF453_17960 [Burkholderiaceae bacterium]